ncbi:integrase, catalytic region, zinc finger, CCHC-type containing protein, partial [Tanacetum coccineum]
MQHPFIINAITLQSIQNNIQFPLNHSYLREDLIECINKAMAFLSAVASRFPPSNNQLRTSSNPRNQATIQDGRVTVQQVQGRQTQSYAGTGNRGIATTSKGNYAAGQPRVVKCYNCQGEGHMARQCTQPKRPRNAAWFKEKLMLAEAQEAGQILDEEQLAFLADPGISEAPVAQQTIPQNSAFQTEDLDAYDSDCDDLSSAKAVLMANLSSCDPEVLSEVPYSDSYPNDMINQDVQEMQYSEQTHIDDFQDNEIHSDSNIILYSQYLQESQDAVIQDTNSSAPNDLLVLSLVEQMTDHVAHLDKENQTNKMVNESLTAELERYKERVTIFEQRLNVDLNKREKLIDSQMDDLIRNRNAKLAAFQQEIDTLKETLSNHVKEKESLTKTLTLNKIKEDFGKCFVTQKELSAEQAFWLKHLSFSETPVTSHTPIRPEAPSELPKDTFNAFDRTLLDEITEVQTVFNQMEAAVDQCFVDKNAFEIQIKQLSIDNDQLLKQIMSQEIVHIAVNSVDILDVKKSCVNECNKCLELETELLKKKDLIEKDVYDKLLKSYSTLEKHCISLELTTQLNQEVFQKDNFCENQNAPTFNQLFELNELKAQSQEKDTVIRKLKDKIKSLSGKDSVENVKKDIDEIETINIELEHTLKNELRKLKGKNIVDTAISKPSATTALGMFKLDIELISYRLKNNRDAHEVYFEKTIENADTLRGLTCPSLMKPTEKLVAVTPINKDKKVRFAEPVTSLSNTPKQNGSLRTKDSNKPLLTFTGVNTTTSASGSKPLGTDIAKITRKEPKPDKNRHGNKKSTQETR